MNRFDKEDSCRFVSYLAKKIALDLDAKDYSSLPVLTDLLMELSEEEMLFAIRSQIGIERCVQHDLDDEAGPFYKVLVRMNDYCKSLYTS